MLEKIRQIIELQRIDSTILNKKDIVDSMPSKLYSAEQTFKEIHARYDKQRQRLEVLEKKKKDKEREVEDINERVKKIKARTSEIKTNKEYQAHLKEIEASEKERYKVEDEILSAMEAIEAVTKELKAEDVRVKAEKEKVEVFKREVEKEIADAEKELNELRVKRDEIARVVDSEIYNDYMKVLEICEGLAVVEAKDEICQGCNMHIPPQMFMEIKKNEEVIQCPQCRRILYWKEAND